MGTMWGFESPGERQRFRLRPAFLVIGVLLSLVTAIIFYLLPVLEQVPESPPPVQGTPSVQVDAPVASSKPAPSHRLIKGEIRQGQTFAQALTAQGLSPSLAGEMIRSLRPHLNFRRIRAGGVFHATFDETGQLVTFHYQVSPVEIYEVIQTETGYRAMRRELPVERRVEMVAGEIYSSLFESMEALGEQPQIALDFVNIFLWDFDFHSQARPGDRFQMLVEKEHSGEVFVRYGKILIAQYENRGKTYTGIYFETAPGKGDFYTSDGTSVRKTFLRSPLQFTRISSGYTHHRRHPILGGVRPHFAIDYAAPHGTPVWAVADGVVLSAGWDGGNGKSIRIQHAGEYQTMYNHLSGFAPGVRRGTKVRQRQVIGYVGSTGLSTGPHLDYRVIKDGYFVNPLTQKFIPGAPIPKPQRVKFQQYRDHLLQQLETGAEKSSPSARGPSASSS
jgi:murein DD-endopeptidase MepM/ murein hydrolase activator NlpD